MKWLVAVFALAATSAFAGSASCDRACAETVKQCQDVCRTKLKDSAPDKVPFCQKQCKDFANECKKDCDKETGDRR